MDSDALLLSHLHDLAYRSYDKGINTFSHFLNMDEQSTTLCEKWPCPFSLEGGYSNAERRIACFGDSPAPPICCIRVSPLQQKFADKLTHRDFLGSLMALGIKREMLGDIIICKNEGYIFCLESISGHIAGELTQVKHTNVKCELTDRIPDGCVVLPDITELVVASERTDSIIAAVYNISRSRSSALFAQEKVFINSRAVTNISKQLNEGDIISVRGSGRFIYEGIKLETKKGKLRVKVRIYK